MYGLQCDSIAHVSQGYMLKKPSSMSIVAAWRQFGDTCCLPTHHHHPILKLDISKSSIKSLINLYNNLRVEMPTHGCTKKQTIKTTIRTVASFFIGNISNTSQHLDGHFIEPSVPHKCLNNFGLVTSMTSSPYQYSCFLRLSFNKTIAKSETHVPCCHKARFHDTIIFILCCDNIIAGRNLYMCQ